MSSGDQPDRMTIDKQRLVVREALELSHAMGFCAVKKIAALKISGSTPIDDRDISNIVANALIEVMARTLIDDATNDADANAMANRIVRALSAAGLGNFERPVLDRVQEN